MSIVLFANGMEFATQNFEEFSKGLNGQTLMILGGVGLGLWYFFGHKLGDIKGLVGGLLNKAKSVASPTSPTNVQNAPVLSGDIFDILSKPASVKTADKENDESDVFFKLIVSWKQTRDLAVKAGCDQAISIADDMFPHLSVNACGKDLNVTKVK